MILNHINQKMPIYKDCTLAELLVVGTVLLFGTCVPLFLLTHFMLGFGWIGLALSILLLVPLTRFSLGRLQKIKFGKPYGYYQQLFLKKLHYSFLGTFLKVPFLQQQGKWSVRRCGKIKI